MFAQFRLSYRKTFRVFSLIGFKRLIGSNKAKQVKPKISSNPAVGMFLHILSLQLAKYLTKTFQKLRYKLS